MDTGSRAYVVRDDGAEPGEVSRIYPYTLRGLTEALDDARLASYGGVPQVVVVLAGGRSRVIRRYDQGHEVPVTPLPSRGILHLAARCPCAAQEGA